VAGVLAEMRKHIQTKDYPELINAEGDIHVIDGQENLLAPMSKKSQKAAHRILTRLGVHVKLKTVVVGYDGDRVILSDGQTIDAKTVIWSAGVTANVFDGIPQSSLGKGNR